MARGAFKAPAIFAFMPRIARVVVPCVPYHITQRGNRRETVFFSDHDRLKFLELLGDYTVRFEVEVLAYCLMGNHVHLVAVPTTRQGLHRVLRPLHMRHAQRINRLKSSNGHLWQGRFFAAALDESYMWTAIRYVERNPVSARIAMRAEDYRWSSAAAHCSLADDPVLTRNPQWTRVMRSVANWSAWLSTGEPAQRLRELRRCTFKGVPCGSPEFVQNLEDQTGKELKDRPRGRPSRSRS